MKKSIVSLALFAIMSLGVAHANASVAPQDLYRFNLSCTFASPGCSADARIFLNTRGDHPSTQAVHPNWFGNLLAVSCATAGGLISASDALLYRVDFDGYHWQITNADGTVSVLLEDHPFDGTSKTVNAKLKVDHEGGVTGTCTVTPTDVHSLN